MLSDKDFALAVMEVNRLAFVANVNVPAHASIVFIELSPRLTEVLPTPRQVFQVTRHDFSVEEVIRFYELYVCEHLEQVAALSREMLRTAKAQRKRGR